MSTDPYQKHPKFDEACAYARRNGDTYCHTDVGPWLDGYDAAMREVKEVHQDHPEDEPCEHCQVYRPPSEMTMRWGGMVCPMCADEPEPTQEKEPDAY